MILCTLEVMGPCIERFFKILTHACPQCHQASMRSSHWLWYVCGSKSIIKAAGLDEMTQDKDLTVLIGWVHYCDVLARFSLRHWQPNLTIDYGDIGGINFEPFHPTVCVKRLVSRTIVALSDGARE